MALGAVTKVKAGVFGDLRYTIVDVAPSSGANYTTGGEGFAAAQVPGATGTVLAVLPVGSAIDATTRRFFSGTRLLRSWLPTIRPPTRTLASLRSHPTRTYLPNPIGF